jgi:hypothetical protein
VLHELYTFGNRDQLFANLLTWLLDAEGEHGLGTEMAHRLGNFLDEHDHAELGMALGSDMLPVSAEVLARGTTADVLVMLAGSPRLALVSLATLTNEPHVLTEYQAMEATPVAVSHLADPGEVSLPLWRWIEDLRALLPQVPAGPFGDFVRQLVGYDPSDTQAASSIVDLQPAVMPQVPSSPPAAGAPAFPTSPPAFPTSAPPAFPTSAPPAFPTSAPPAFPTSAPTPSASPASPAPPPQQGPPSAPGWGGEDSDWGGGGGLSDGWMNG